MIATQNNKFSIEYNTRLNGFYNGTPAYIISADGKIKTKHEQCPRCKSTNIVDNGYHFTEDSFICNLGLKIKIGQFCCNNCGHFWSSDRQIIDEVIKEEKKIVKTLLLGAVRQGLSLERARIVVKNAIGRTYSTSYLQEMYNQALDQVKEEKRTSASGVYYYDEQYIAINGKDACRLTIKDAVTEKIILDKQTEDAQKETIKTTIKQALDSLPADAFIVDMRQGYPEIIKELYPKAKIQWCIFHLYKLIWKELQDKYGKKIPLHELYNVYSIFNIFFDHKKELEKLKEILNKYDKIKTNDDKTNQEITKPLRKEFSEFVKSLKKERRRKHQKIPRRTLAESEKLFKIIKEQILLYSTKIQKRILYIGDNWEKFTLFQKDKRVQPTSNGIEQYFAATLCKTDKKDFRNEAAVIRELKACRAEWNGQEIFTSTNLIKLLTLTGMLFLAFPPA